MGRYEQFNYILAVYITKATIQAESIHYQSRGVPTGELSVWTQA